MLPSPQGRNVHISVSVLWDRLEVYVEGELMPIKLSIRENKLKTEDVGQGTSGTSFLSMKSVPNINCGFSEMDLLVMSDCKCH